MPYLIDTNHIKLPRHLDRRVKITEEMKKDILKQYDKGTPIRQIARNYPDISRRSIQYIIYPERALKVKQQYKERQQHRTSYAKVRGAKWASIMREHRKYRKSCLYNPSSLSSVKN